MAIQGASKISCRAAYEKFGEGDSFNTEAQRRRVDVPFALPQGWTWARLDSLCHSIADGDHQAPPQEISGIPFLVISNVSNGVLDFSNTRFVGEDYYKSLKTTRIASKGDILVTVTGSYGIIVRVDTDRHFCFQRHIALLKCCGNGSDYLFNALQSNIVKRYFDAIATGTAQKTVALNHLRNTLIPIPPLAEQKRIVAKIDELFAIADSLGTAADGLENAAKRLDKKILDLAIRGRLVPQDPNDEPASELVKRIAASHKSPSKNQGEPIDPPFVIPQSWEWVRLGAICEILDSKRKPVAKSKRKPGPYPYYGATCIQDFVSDFIFDEPLVLLGEDGAKWGKGDKSAFCVDGKIWVNNHAHVLRPCDGINHIYLVCTLDILDLMPYVTGTTVPKLNQEKMCDIKIPLPPLAEQKRIVSKIEELRTVIKSLTT